MSTPTPPNPQNPCRAPRRLLARGEALIATLGISTVAVLLAALCSVAWVSLQEQRQLLDAARREHVRAISELLGHTAEVMLASGELSSLRRLVLDTAREHRLVSCQIILPDGRLLAAADPAKVQIARIPANCPMPTRKLTDRSRRRRRSFRAAEASELPPF